MCILLYTCANVICIKFLLTYLLTYIIPSGILIHPAIWLQQTWAKNWGAMPLFSGSGAGPHLAQYGLGWGLSPYQVASSSIQPFGHNRYRPKIGGLCPFERGELGPHLKKHCKKSFLLVNLTAVSLHCSNYNGKTSHHFRYLGDPFQRYLLYVTEICRTWGSDVRTVDVLFFELEISIMFSYSTAIWSIEWHICRKSYLFVLIQGRW